MLVINICVPNKETKLQEKKRNFVSDLFFIQKRVKWKEMQMTNALLLLLLLTETERETGTDGVIPSYLEIILRDTA